MADENIATAPPANRGGKSKGGGTVVVRLLSAGANDTFVIGHPDNPDAVITTQGVEVPVEHADEILEFGAQHGVTLAYEAPTDKE